MLTTRFGYLSFLRSTLLIAVTTLSACGPSVKTPADLQAGGVLQSQSLQPALCGTTQHLYVAAHEDDDLLFMSPDLPTSIQMGHCVLTVYLTAGDFLPGTLNYNTRYGTNITLQGYMSEREAGVMEAYAKQANQPNAWTATTVEANGMTLRSFILTGNPRIQLVFMRLPDGADGDFDPVHYKSLAKLWLTTDPTMTMDAIDGSNRFTRTQLISTLATLMNRAAPKYIHMQDSDPDYFILNLSGTEYGDHTDHIMGARFVEEAENLYLPQHMTVRYRDYNISAEAYANLSPSDVANKQSIFATYAKNDRQICPFLNPCDVSSFNSWLQRQYFNVADNQQGAVLRDGLNRVNVFLTGERSSSVIVSTQTAVNSSSWTPWIDTSGNFSARPVVAAYSDGRFAAFIHSNNGEMWVSAQNAAGAWSPYVNLQGAGVSDAAAALSPKGELQVFAISNGGQVVSRTDTTGTGSWSPWQTIGAKFGGFTSSSNPAATILKNGRAVIFVRDDASNLWYATHKPGPRNWSNWINLGSSVASDPVVITNALNLLEVFMRDSGGFLVHRAETSDGVWGPWEQMSGIRFEGLPVVISRPDGSVSVLVRDVVKLVTRITRASPTAFWSGWQYVRDTSLNPVSSYYLLPDGTTFEVMSLVGATTTADGRESLVVRGYNGRIYRTEQTTVPGTWAAWTLMPTDH